MTMAVDRKHRDFDVLLYGATGYTGRLVAHGLQEAGLAFAIAGRNQARLLELRSRLDSRPESLAVGLDEPGRLREAAARARVVLSCAGPFARCGPPVQDAALAAGSHFLDVTGEFGYMLATWRRDAEARAAGVVLLNAAGFDVVPSDLCAWLACRGLVSPARVDVVLDQNTARITRGTALSILGILGSGGLRHEAGQWVEEPPGAHGLTVPMPSGQRRAISVPLGDVVTAPRTTGARDVRAYMTAGSLSSRLVPWVAPWLGRAARGRLGRLAAGWLERGPEGPSDSERAASRFSIWARAADAEGRSQFATLEGRDPYGLTAVVAAFLAARLAREGAGLSGALTPCQVADPLALRDLLLAHGVTVFAPEPFVGGW